MKLASYLRAGHPSVGVVVGEHLHDVHTLWPDAPTSMRGFLEWKETQPDIGGVDHSGTEPTSLEGVVFLPVVPDPHAIWCAALTYLSHVREGGDRPVPDYPMFFLRVANSQVGHNVSMECPDVSELLDYEGELAVVIGQAGRHIPQEEAFKHIAGYTCYNDGSVRDWQRHTPQITPGKNFSATGGFGPWLVTPDEFGDPATHSLETRLNGAVMQSAKISELLFPVDYMVHYLSTICRLEVGDVIVTGTCGGVGVRRTPPVFMKPGDVVEVEIDGIGVLRNPIAAEVLT